MSAAQRGRFEAYYGTHLGGVRIHTGARANASARALNALAYTLGQDVIFAEGSYAPHTAQGNRLLAHELAHVMQHRRGDPLAIQRQEAGMTSPDAPASMVVPAPLASFVVAPSEQVEFEGHWLTIDAARMRSIFTPIFLEAGAAGLSNFLG
ncbi:MAG: DUF4157 domain-containing protein, partial [Oricola sp.]